jgi:glycosyltransferase involved in cell wall biosynthesis
MEAEVIRYADKIIMVTEPICEMYRRRYPEYTHKFITITNGFDSEDYLHINTVKEEKFTICYSGILTEGQSPETLIKAIEKLIELDGSVRDNLNIKFIGFMLEEYKSRFLNSSIRENFTLLDYMPHKECLEHMKGADINLMILADKEESKGVFSGKIFDYIGVERPILGIMPEGVASNLIMDKNIGKSFNHGDIDGVFNWLKDNYILWKSNSNVATNAKEKCEEYDRVNLTKQLIGVFEELKSN